MTGAYFPPKLANPLTYAADGRESVLGKVLGLLGFAAAFTAGGAVLGAAMGRVAILVSIVGVIASFLALRFLKERAPYNLVLLYIFATFEGLGLGVILSSYVAAGFGQVVIDAGATTALITLGAGMYGMSTRRDLSNLSSMLGMALFAIIIASIIGIFIKLPLFHLILSIITAVVFTGFLVVDLNRLAKARELSDGDSIMLAINVYLDIINIFLSLLRIFRAFGARR